MGCSLCKPSFLGTPIFRKSPYLPTSRRIDSRHIWTGKPHMSLERQRTGCLIVHCSVSFSVSVFSLQFGYSSLILLDIFMDHIHSLFDIHWYLISFSLCCFCSTPSMMTSWSLPVGMTRTRRQASSRWCVWSSSQQKRPIVASRVDALPHLVRSRYRYFTQQYIYIHIYIYTHIYTYLYIYIYTYTHYYI